MERLKLLKRVQYCLRSGSPDSLNLSLNNVHSEGLFSLVVDNVEFGKLTRVFIAEKKIKPFDVQFHTHRYPIRLTTIKGQFKHHVAKECYRKEVDTCTISKFDYKSFLNGGSGLKYEKEVEIVVSDYTIPNGSTIEMNTVEYHTVSCAKGTIWIVQELGFEKDSSKVLGVPFIVDSLYTKPEMFQINDKAQLVLREISKMISEYESA